MLHAKAGEIDELKIDRGSEKNRRNVPKLHNCVHTVPIREVLIVLVLIKCKIKVVNCHSTLSAQFT